MSTPPQRFQAVLFDCDGVLVDSETITNGVLRVMLHELGWPISVEECVDRFIGRALSDEFDVIEEHTGIRPDQAWLLEFRARRNTALAVDLQPIDGAVAAVAAVAAAFDGRIACASGADRAKIELQLAKVGLAEVFGAHVYSGMETARSKPAPDVYLAAAAGLGVDPSACAVVEDTVAGVTAGVAAGATVFGFASGGLASTAPEALIAAGASRVFTRMAELPGLLAASEPAAGVAPAATAPIASTT
ncbi:HAD family phosphatase [Agromyces sp. Leaf222]|uniref:HAD family hydrolase n=1 Tax=Agromyces sp. Leaf222 TaxID=1735688 RepID=UPI0007020766|nr:HAD family phosphatase [Agromyces sp. Leaf222]KQM80672.1 HAD family hydrolase [Agromyces sp. Leaf222]